MLEAGTTAPEFSLKDLAGERQSLRANLKNGPVLAAFFKISCPTCQLTMPFLERLSGRLRAIGISQDSAAATAEFNTYYKLTLPTLIDPVKDHYAVSSAYRLTHVPSMFLIEPTGKISWTLEGFHKGELETLAQRFGVELFQGADRVPAMKPG